MTILFISSALLPGLHILTKARTMPVLKTGPSLFYLIESEWFSSHVFPGTRCRLSV